MFVASVWASGQSSLVFNNSFGGSRSNRAVAIALDPQGNIYVAGQTNSADFPVLNALQNHPGAVSLSVSSDGGQTFTSAGLSTAAAVNWLAAAPGAPPVIYAAADGNVFKSTDGGTTWTAPANTGLSSGITAIAVDAGSPSTIYAASARGLYLSTDGASSWSLSSLVSTTATNVVTHPAVPGTVFAMTQNPNSLYRSRDSGQTWTALSIAPPNQPAFPVAIVFDPANPQNLILGQSVNAMLKSGDGGDTWTQISFQNVQSSSDLAADPANPSVLYVASVKHRPCRANAGDCECWCDFLERCGRAGDL